MSDAAVPKEKNYVRFLNKWTHWPTLGLAIATTLVFCSLFQLSIWLWIILPILVSILFEVLYYAEKGKSNIIISFLGGIFIVFGFFYQAKDVIFSNSNAEINLMGYGTYKPSEPYFTIREKSEYLILTLGFVNNTYSTQYINDIQIQSDNSDIAATIPLFESANGTLTTDQLKFFSSFKINPQDTVTKFLVFKVKEKTLQIGSSTKNCINFKFSVQKANDETYLTKEFYMAKRPATSTGNVFVRHSVFEEYKCN